MAVLISVFVALTACSFFRDTRYLSILHVTLLFPEGISIPRDSRKLSRVVAPSTIACSFTFLRPLPSVPHLAHSEHSAGIFPSETEVIPKLL